MMKKKILTALACLSLVLGAGCITACDNEDKTEVKETVYSISDLLVYDRIAGEFDLTGQQVKLLDVIVTSTHGRTITVAESTSAVAIEVVLKDDSPSATMMTLVNVTGTMNTYHGRAQICDATIEIVSGNQQNFYYTTGFARSSGFDNYGRTDSGMIGGGMGSYKPCKFRVVSYNGATEYKEGEDLLITVVYQGDDYNDPYYWIDVLLFGDSDASTIAYYNAFFFGTDTTVTWSSPFGGRSDRQVISAGWEGIDEGEYFSCQLIHFFYDEEYNPDFGSMFFLDNVCLPYADKLELYNEESALGTALGELQDAFEEGDEAKASYENSVSYSYNQGETLSLSEYNSMTSTALSSYMRNLDTLDRDSIEIKATPTYYSVEEYYTYEEEQDDEIVSITEYSGTLFYNEEAGGCVAYQFDEEGKEALDAYLEDPTEGNIDDYTAASYGYVWTDLIDSLYNLGMYSRSFHQNGTTCEYNDDSIADNLYDSLDGYLYGYNDDFYDYYGFGFELDSLTYNSTTQTLKAEFYFGAWWYADTSYSSVYYAEDRLVNTVTLHVDDNEPA